MEAIKQLIVCSFAYMHSSYTLILHVSTKILYIRACFRGEAKISCVCKWVSFCHFNTTTNGKKRCTVYFLNRAKCVFIFPEGHWSECHTNIRVLLLNKNLSTPEILKQVCCPVLCVSSCRKKQFSRMLAIQIPCAKSFFFLLSTFIFIYHWFCLIISKCYCSIIVFICICMCTCFVINLFREKVIILGLELGVLQVI